MENIFRFKRTVAPAPALAAVAVGVGCLFVAPNTAAEAARVAVEQPPPALTFWTPGDLRALKQSDNRGQVAELSAKWLSNRRQFFALKEIRELVPKEQVDRWYLETMPTGFRTDFKVTLPRDISLAFAELEPESLAQIIMRLRDTPVQDPDGQPVIDRRTGEPMIAADRSNFIDMLAQLAQTEKTIWSLTQAADIPRNLPPGVRPQPAAQPGESPQSRASTALPSQDREDPPKNLLDLIRKACAERALIAADMGVKQAAGDKAYHKVVAHSYTSDEPETSGCTVWYVQAFWTKGKKREEKALAFPGPTSPSVDKRGSGIWVFWVRRNCKNGPDLKLQIDDEVPSLGLREPEP